MLFDIPQKVFVRSMTNYKFGDINFCNMGINDLRYLSPMKTFRTQPTFTLHYVISGKGVLDINNTKYNLEAGCFFMIPPNTNFLYYPDETDPWKYFWFGLKGNPETITTLFKLSGFCLESCTYQCKNKVPVQLALQPVIDSLSMDEHIFIFIVSSAFYQILSIILKEKKELHFKNTSSVSVEKIKSYINENYHDTTLCIEDILQNFHYSHHYFCRLFKSTTGMSMKQYLIQVRLKKACEFLTFLPMTVKEIAYAVGFSDDIHFSKIFKKNFDVTPGKYRDLLSQK